MLKLKMKSKLMLIIKKLLYNCVRSTIRTCKVKFNKDLFYIIQFLSLLCFLGLLKMVASPHPNSMRLRKCSERQRTGGSEGYRRGKQFTFITGQRFATKRKSTLRLFLLSVGKFTSMLVSSPLYLYLSPSSFHPSTRPYFSSPFKL